MLSSLSVESNRREPPSRKAPGTGYHPEMKTWRRLAFALLLAGAGAGFDAARAQSPAPSPRPTCDALPKGPANANLGDQDGGDEPVVIGTNSTAGNVSTRGGLVVVGANGQAGHIKTKSGLVVVGSSGTVASITTETGSVETCANTRISGDVVTFSGSVTVGVNSEIEGRIRVQVPATLPAKPPVIRLGTNVEVRGIELGYPARICYGTNATGGEITGAKPLPCR